MKLVLATPLYPPEIGGPSTYAKALADGLPARGIDVAVVKFSEVRHLPRFVRHYLYFRKVLRAARGADLVFALDPVSVGFPAMRAAQKAGKPFLVKIVGDYAWEQGKQRFGIQENLDEFVKKENMPSGVMLLRKMQTRVAVASTRIIVPSEYLKKIVMAWGIPAEKISVIYNAVSLDRLGKIPPSVAGLPRPLVVSAGRLVPWKNMKGIIDAVASPGHNDRASLAIVGEGPLYGELRSYAAKKLGKAAVMVGRQNHADTLAIIASADVFVLNSLYEGLSHLLIEALALGVPVVATKAGGNPEIVADGENGVLIPTDDARSLADSLARLFADSDLRSRLASRAREAAARFSEPAMLDATAGFLKQLV